MVKMRLFVLAILFAFVTLNFVSAATLVTHATGLNTTTVLEDTTRFYNISVNNTDAGSPANITQVNITLPSTFTITGSTNGSDTIGSPTVINGQVLSWRNVTTYLINGSQRKFFWFNATAATPGTYNFTITTTNGTTIFNNNVSVTINDTTTPSSSDYGTGTETNGNNITRTFFIVNVSGTDNGLLDRIIITVYNSTGLFNRSTSASVGASSGSYWINFTGLVNGTYWINATVNDSAGNANTTIPTYIVIVDTVAPTVGLNTPVNKSSTTATAMNFTFNVTETNSLANCSLIFSEVVAGRITTGLGGTATYGIYFSSLSEGVYNWSVNCTDTAGLVGKSEYWILTVTASEEEEEEEDNAGGGGGGGSFGPTYSPPQNTLESEKGYSLTTVKNGKIKFKSGGADHSAKLLAIDANAKTLSVEFQSEPHTISLAVGETKEVDLEGDGFNDVSVFVKEIKGRVATLVIKLIHTAIPGASAAQPVQTPATTTTETATQPEPTQLAPEQSNGSNSVMIGVVAVIVIVIVIIGLIVAFRARKK